MEFGWWSKDDDGKKWQICADFFGGNVTWQRKHGHHSSWEPHQPTDDDWDELIGSADRRLQRRLISPRQFADLKKCRPQ